MTIIHKLSWLAAVVLLTVPGLAGEYPTPPAEHPRLYIRANEIPELRTRMQRPEGQAIFAKMRAVAQPRTAAEEERDTELRHGIFRFRNSSYFVKMRGLPMRCELLALDYLVNRTPESADTAICEFLDSLKKVNFGRRYDMSRASGTMIMAGSIIYDWCYDRMTADVKKQYISEFLRIAATMECDWPPTPRECITGHGSEYMVLRDLLSAGIAVYDECPEIYNTVVPLIYDYYVPPRNFIFKGRNYHQGSQYVGARHTNDFISNWILTRMGAQPPYVPDMQYTLYDMIYRLRPDGILLPAGDTRPRGGVNCSETAMFSYSYFHDPYVKWLYEFHPAAVMNPHLILELLWRDFDTPSRTPENLPLYRYSGTPFGWTIARTGWDKNSVIAEMKVNEHAFGNHQHLDGGSFQIYYKGPLAIDSGNYHGAGGQYNSPHVKTWHKRTIAHNSLLVFDPDEVFLCWNYGGEDKTSHANNEGGQRLPGRLWGDCNSMEDLLGEPNTVGKVLAHSESNGWSHLKGDITKAYSAKVSDVRRSFTFVNTGREDVRALMFIYDHVVSTNPDFKKFFLLHSIEEPAIEGRRYTVKRTLMGDSGMLWCNALLPENVSVRKEGGPEREFWAFGSNYPNDINDPYDESGAWRVEVCPSKPAAEDCFLNVIQVGDNDCTAFRDAVRIDGDECVGAYACGNAVIFHRGGKTFENQISFTLPEKASVIITDLTEGEWTIKYPGKSVKKNVTGEAGCLCINGPAGKWKLFRNPVL